jgi:UDP-glucose 4-epimerase
MAILVTGGAGYIGSVTVERILRLGEEVVVLDNLVRGHRGAISRDVPFYQGEVKDRELLTRIAREHKLESCIHFAGLAYVGESVVKPAEYFECNVEQGIALLGFLVRVGINQIVFSSSCATYGEVDKVPIPEETPQRPKNPYGWSKLFIERILDSYDSAYGMRFVSLRYFNAAGATERNGEFHEPETHLIPNVLAAAIGKKASVSVYGNTYTTRDGTAVRDYIHVRDLADAHIKALEHLRGGGKSEFLNLGTGCGYSVLDVIENACLVTGREIRIEIEPPRPGDPAVLIADPTKAQAVLGWKAVASDLPTILLSQWDWLNAHPQGYR